MNAIRLAGVTPTRKGYRIDPHLPFGRFKLRTTRIGVAAAGRVLRGYVRVEQAGPIELRVRVPRGRTCSDRVGARADGAPPPVRGRLRHVRASHELGPRGRLGRGLALTEAEQSPDKRGTVPPTKLATRAITKQRHQRDRGQRQHGDASGVERQGENPEAGDERGAPHRPDPEAEGGAELGLPWL